MRRWLSLCVTVRVGATRASDYAPPPMRPAPLAPSVHLFVCVNRRPADSPLGLGCGDAGEQVFALLKDEVAKRGAYRTVWVTRTLCLGICPPRGCTVATYPRQDIVSEVNPSDATALFERALAGGRP
jgi:(2Fe-2S) ferredoxin